MPAVYSNFVAIGDSFTEGVGDPFPDDTGYRGWADLFAERAAKFWPDFAYANLAVRGRLFDRIVDEQVPPAIKQNPDLVSFVAGGNDALRPGFNPHQLSTRAHEVVRLFKASGSEVVLFTCADVTCLLPGMKFLRKRFIALNDAFRRVAKRHDAVLVDLWNDESFSDPQRWAEDRLHLSTYGHQRVAVNVCEALGVEPADEWLEPLPAHVGGKGPRLDVTGAQWARKHLAPWVKRRITGKSSGDTIEPKRPRLKPVN